MKTHRVRRLPVVGFGNTVIGVVSMSDLVLAAGPKRPVRSDDVVATFKAICAHHPPTSHLVAALQRNRRVPTGTRPAPP